MSKFVKTNKQYKASPNSIIEGTVNVKTNKWKSENKVWQNLSVLQESKTEIQVFYVVVNKGQVMSKGNTIFLKRQHCK